LRDEPLELNLGYVDLGQIDLMVQEGFDNEGQTTKLATPVFMRGSIDICARLGDLERIFEELGE
jgi:Ribbon-Helix-Helix transcriptional regulator family